MMFGGIAILVGYAVASKQVGPWGKTPPEWLNNLQSGWIVLFTCSGGLVVVSDRVTRMLPDFFALVYVGLVSATLGIAILLTRPAFRMFRWVSAACWSVFGIIVAVLITLGNPNDPVAGVLGTYWWLIPGLLIGLFCWFPYSYFFRKAPRLQIWSEALVATAIVGWFAIVIWVGGWLK